MSAGDKGDINEQLCNSRWKALNVPQNNMPMLRSGEFDLLLGKERE